MVATELKPDKILMLDSFIEIIEAVDDKIRKNEPDKIEKLKKIYNSKMPSQGALYEILTKAHEFETYKEKDLLFPYETVIDIQVITNQQLRTWSDEMLSRLV